MPAPALEVAHFFSNFRSLGGVESVLQQHHAKDLDCGLRSRFIILSEAPSPAQPVERVFFLGINSWSTIRGVRKQLASSLAVPQPLVAIYHTLIPMRAFVCGSDLAARRILFLHGKGDGLREQLEPRATWLDGVICVNEETRAIAQNCLPGLKPDRFILVPLPITACPGQVAHRPLAGRPVIIGYSGRLLREHKRVDRLPEFCGHLDHLGVDYRLEILGDGPERFWLEGQFQGNPRVQLLGRQEGEAYRQQLNTWDFVVFVSDTEGQPVSLLEAMSGGVLPLFPRIGSAGDAYAETVDQSLLYRAGATEEAARIIFQLSQASDEEIQRLRARSLSAVQPNLDGSYFGGLANFARQVLGSPRASTDKFPWHSAALDYFPLVFVSRLALLRRGLLRTLGSRRAMAPRHND